MSNSEKTNVESQATDLLISTDTLISMSDEDAKVAQEDCADDFVILNDIFDDDNREATNYDSVIIDNLILIDGDDLKNEIPEPRKDILDLVEKLEKENEKLKLKVASLEEEKLILQINDAKKCSDVDDPETIFVTLNQGHVAAENSELEIVTLDLDSNEEKLERFENLYQEIELKILALQGKVSSSSAFSQKQEPVKNYEKQLQILSSFYKSERLRFRLMQENLAECEEILGGLNLSDVTSKEHQKKIEDVESDIRDRRSRMLNDVVKYGEESKKMIGVQKEYRSMFQNYCDLLSKLDTLEEDRFTAKFMGSTRTECGCEALEGVKWKYENLALKYTELQDALSQEKQNSKKTKRTMKNKMRRLRKKKSFVELIKEELEEQIEELQNENKKLKKKTKKFYMITNR